MESVIFGFVSDKGGVGKTTNSINLMNSLSKKYKVLYIDSDYKKQACNLRQEDIDLGIEGFTYDIVYVPTNQMSDRIGEFFGNYDFILIDLPGSRIQPGVIECYALYDVVFIPTRTARVELNESIAFMEVYRDEYMKGNQEQEQHVLFNGIKGNAKSSKAMIEDDSMSQLIPFPILRHHVKDLIAFQNDLNTKDFLNDGFSAAKEMTEILERKRKELIQEAEKNG